MPSPAYVEKSMPKTGLVATATNKPSERMPCAAGKENALIVDGTAAPAKSKGGKNKAASKPKKSKKRSRTEDTKTDGSENVQNDATAAKLTATPRPLPLATLSPNKDPKRKGVSKKKHKPQSQSVPDAAYQGESAPKKQNKKTVDPCASIEPSGTSNSFENKKLALPVMASLKKMKVADLKGLCVANGIEPLKSKGELLAQLASVC